jgi:hypothetical protein
MRFGRVALGIALIVVGASLLVAAIAHVRSTRELLFDSQLSEHGIYVLAPNRSAYYDIFLGWPTAGMSLHDFVCATGIQPERLYLKPCKDHPSAFDFTWSIKEGPSAVAAGSSRDRLAWAEGNPQFLYRFIGTASLHADHRYQLTVLGAAQDSILKTPPRLQVKIAGGYAEGELWLEPLAALSAVVLGGVGLTLVWAGLRRPRAKLGS